MYHSSVLFLATFAAFVGNSVGIIGGQNAEITSYPYQVSVRIQGEHYCGGTIFAKNVVVTAANCIRIDGLTEKDYSVQYGLTNIGGTENLVNVTKLIVHEKYTVGAPDYDCGLIILASDIPQGPNAQFISLATVRPAAGTNAFVTGWGTRDQIEVWSDTLQGATLQTISNEECQKQYSDDGLVITDRLVCAGVPKADKDACFGDSGNPLVANGQLVGIVSGGLGCGVPGVYGLYTDVASVREWILEASL